MQLAKLRRARFGQSSEKLDHDIEQLELLIGDLEEDASERRSSRQGGCHGAAWPDRRPRAQTSAAHAAARASSSVKSSPTIRVRVCPGCGGTVFSRIGQDERDVLEYVPSSFKVIQHLRPKLSCRSCKTTIIQAPMPALPIERGRPEARADHPCRRVEILRPHPSAPPGGGSASAKGLSWTARRSPIGWDRLCSCWLRWADAIGRHVRAGVALHADDTTVPVLSPGLGKTKTGRLWVAVRDERPWGSDVPPAAFYRYSADRKGIHVEALLGDYRGFLHADGYGGFTRFYKPTTPLGDAPLVEVACWSHARRHFYDVHHQTASPIALEALHQIAALFAVESHIRGKPPDQRTATRREHAQPLLERLKQFLETELVRVSGKSSLAEAIRYTLSRWMALTRYVTDGRLEISNNAAERAMKPPVLGRKNYLFCGSDAGGQRAACMYTIVETCRMNDINPQAYLTDIIGRIADHPIQKIDDLLPWRWKS